ncbi:MAG: OsmC family protein [Bacteroidetes bacterium]|nr:OsmC family protein [Bacteroidota bacterium]
MNEAIHTDWIGNMSFDSDVDGYQIHFDAEEKFGGTRHGPRPKPVVLSALAACTGMDVVSILGKKQVKFTAFRISAKGEVTEDYPKYYQKIHLVYIVSGPGFKDNDEIRIKVNRAVRLSRDNYCAVSAMLKNSCEITDEIILQDS